MGQLLKLTERQAVQNRLGSWIKPGAIFDAKNIKFGFVNVCRKNFIILFFQDVSFDSTMPKSTRTGSKFFCKF